MNPVENIRLSERARTQLITVKRRTGIRHWNVLCRWALCLSLAQKTVPPDENIPADSSVEMTWKTFSGGDEDLYWGLLMVRAEKDGITMNKNALAHYFRLHLHRGISYLAGANGPQSLPALVALATDA
jgi:DNA sulfur modification protein DndE